MNATAIRTRLHTVIRKKFGTVDQATVRQVAMRAGVSYSTLARFLIYEGDGRTRLLRRRTLHDLAVGLDVNTAWLLDGQGTQQLGIWPILSSTSAETTTQRPLDQVQIVVDLLGQLPDRVLTRVCRAIVSTILATVVSNDAIMPAEAYRCLMRLDALHRSDAGRVAS
jgi:hypothetical protein